MLSIDKKQILIEHYEVILLVTSNLIKIRMKEYVINITGEGLHVLALTKDEILIEGTMDAMGFVYES